MNDKKITLFFLALGCIAGFFSNYSPNFLSLLLPATLYLIPALFFYFRLRVKKRKKVLVDSLITFILVWILVWTLLYNLR